MNSLQIIGSETFELSRPGAGTVDIYGNSDLTCKMSLFYF